MTRQVPPIADVSRDGFETANAAQKNAATDEISFGAGTRFLV